MILQRRFYVLFVFSCFALLSTYVFLNRNNLPVSIPSTESWTASFDDAPATPTTTPLIDSFPVDNEHNKDGLKTISPADGVSPVNEHDEARPSKVDETSSTSTLLSPSTSTLLSPATHKPKMKPSGSKKPAAEEKGPLRIAVLESGGSHDEVTAALVHAFGSQKRAEISIYVLLQRYGIAGIMDDFNLTSPIAVNTTSYHFDKAIKEGPPPQILVSATCELDLVRHSASFEALLAGNKTFLFCIIHHADRWVKGDLVEKIHPWVDKQMVHFLGLSSHTSHYFRTEAVQNWPYNATVVVNYIPPVFPVNIQNTTTTGKEPLTLAMQGDFSTSRRNYTAIFEHLGDVVNLTKNRTSPSNKTTSHDVQLRLLGHGNPPKIPKEISSHVALYERLDYPTYYSMLSQTFSLLPAFATTAYLDRKASSSIPAALIAGTPLIASEEILGAYAYLPFEAVWLQYGKESEMDVVQRIVLWSDEEHALKKSKVRNACERLVQTNIEMVENWVGTAILKIQRASWTS
jgi:hypothetical protein